MAKASYAQEREWIRKTLQDHAEKHREEYKRIGSHDVAIAVLATKVALYSAFGGALAGFISAVIWEMTKKGGG